MDQEEKKSKSQVKRELHDLEKLGERLAKLPAGQIRNMDVPEELKEALLFAQTITTRKAGKRQRKYIGALMRNVEMEPVQRVLAQIDGDHNADTHHFQGLEQLRDDLVADNQAVLDDLLNRYPQTDRQRLMQLIRGARKEQELGKPPKSYRLLFAYLRELSENKKV
jgi:ribosome-associated protein